MVARLGANNQSNQNVCMLYHYVLLYRTENVAVKQKVKDCFTSLLGGRVPDLPKEYAEYHSPFLGPVRRILY